MPVNYEATVKNARLMVVRDAIDAGAAEGKLKIYSAAYAALLVTITLADPSAGIADGVLTLSGMPKSGIASAAGIAAIARITDSDDTMVAEGLTVGLVATDIIIDNTNIALGQTVTLNSGTITHG